MSILDYIYNFVYNFFVSPVFNFIGNYGLDIDTDSPITLTMPGSDVVLLSTNIQSLFVIGTAIFLFIASIVFFWGVIKMLYKVGRSLFGGRR